MTYAKSTSKKKMSISFIKMLWLRIRESERERERVLFYVTMFTITKRVYGRTNIVLKMVNYFNCSDRGKSEYSYESLSQCHFVHQNLRKVWPRIEAELRGEKAATNLFEPWQGLTHIRT